MAEHPSGRWSHRTSKSSNRKTYSPAAILTLVRAMEMLVAPVTPAVVNLTVSLEAERAE
jgi:hypothetical protein